MYLHTLYNPTFINKSTGQRMPNDSGWQTRHLAAMRRPISNEHAIVQLLEGWARLADKFRADYESPIGSDGYTGPIWADLGRSIRALLNTDTGRLDCGTIDGFIVDTMAAEECEP